MVLEESLLCKCCNCDALVSYYVGGVSFGNKIPSVGSESLSLEGLPIWVLFWGLGVISSVHSTNVHFPNAED